MEEAMQQPKAEKIEKIWQRTTGEFVDHYAWMTHKKPHPPQMLKYLEEENKYSNAYFAKHEKLTNQIFNEIKTRTKETDISCPYPDGDYYYTSRTEEGKQYEIHSRGKTEEEATQQIIVDENELAKSHDFFDLGTLEISPNHERVAYSVDITGDENYFVYFKEIDSGHVYPEKLEKSFPSGAAWSADSNYFFYTKQDDQNRPYQLWRHKIGESAEKDVLVFEEDDERYYLEVELSRSQKYIIVSTSSIKTNEVYVLPSSSPLSPLVCVRKRQQDVEYWVHDWGTHFIILTNENAVNFRIMIADHSTPGEWKELIKEEKGIRITSVRCFSSLMAILDWHKGQQRIRIVHKNDDYTQEVINFKEEPHQLSFYHNPLFSPPSLLLSSQSLSSPSAVYSYDFETKKSTLKKQKEILGVELENYVSERIWVDSDDVSVPVDLVYSTKVIDRQTPNKLLMYGYGSYEISVPPRFSASRLSLLDRGFIYALCHPRGGGEMGREWYEEGKLLKKKNTFNDFIASAKHLVKTGWTTPDLLVIRGASAGGLLIGSSVTMEPDLFHAAIAEVPFVDVVTTMYDKTIPLTANEWEEWGDPNDAEVEHYQKSYSPYDNTVARNYPSLYVTAGINDMRVSVHEPAKWVAKLRELATNNPKTHPILFRTEMAGGHFGPSGRYEEWKDEARTLTFVVMSFESSSSSSSSCMG
uniref:Prolyl endopeptidase n=1 Tax=Paramoeba aestuarina TaxID=180227 RepID=A0A7S4L2N8_9EUKA|eukprot:CAMPEP_0201507748 /NCGR_PEP_ID=MMETSP0161_2-20130828/1320_1 /ASSEMBLY_ACC=CAM_ASM_000251 /TAXON_ID=180227 /ORGANISM="Neoparamoeba aestuarina, Strain SoJaBio B1-5/56/2" /LENGTH=695 /DNA_ID=CAMNT_0047902197 /DNA_START=50 /DNA_END=2137 /DNA_ORIENTATION=-